MRSRLPQYLAIVISALALATPLLGEARKGKAKAKAPAVEAATATPKKKGSPTPSKKNSSASPKPEESSEATPRPTPKGTPKATPRGTPKGTPKVIAPATATPTPAPEPTTAPDPSATPKPSSKFAANASISPDELVEYAEQPERVKSLIADALAMTQQKLTYTYGSADPSSGGMDCSGTIYYLLRKAGFNDVPRDSSSQYAWVRKAGTFRSVVSRSIDSFEFGELLPGDLLFWTGTYQVQREIPVSHVMLYLGTEKATKRKVMFGASDGRTYAGISRNGVSVFDFKMPRARAEGAVANEGRGAVFIGYGRIPRLREATATPPARQLTAADSAQDAPVPKEEPSPAKSEAAPSTGEEPAKQVEATPRTQTKKKAATTRKSTPGPKKRSRAD